MQKDIIGLDVAREYLRHKYRQNCKANTLKNDFTTVTLFLSYLTKCSRSELKKISRADLEAFVEHGQERGLRIVSISDRLGSLYAFLRYLIEQDLADAELLQRKIKLKVPDALLFARRTPAKRHPEMDPACPIRCVPQQIDLILLFLSSYQ